MRLVFGTCYRTFCPNCSEERLFSRLQCSSCKATLWPAADVAIPKWMRSALVNFQEGKHRALPAVEARRAALKRLKERERAQRARDRVKAAKEQTKGAG